MLIFKRRREENAALYHAEVSKDDVKAFDGPTGLDLKVLADILTCKLCDGFFCEAHTIKECLHTYCRSCIVGYVHDGGKVCPTCGERFQGPSIDEVSYDRTIQNLVDKLFPNFQKEETARKKAIFEFCGFPLDEENRPVNATDLATYNLSGGGSRIIGKNAINLHLIRNGNNAPARTLSEMIERQRRVVSASGLVDMPPSAATPSILESAFNAAAELDQSREEDEEQEKQMIESKPAVATEEFLVNAKALVDTKETISCPCVTIQLIPADDETPEMPNKFIRVPISMTVQYLMQYVLFRANRDPNDWQDVILTCTNAPLARTHSLEFVCRLRRFPFQNRSAVLDIKFKLPDMS